MIFPRSGPRACSRLAGHPIDRAEGGPRPLRLLIGTDAYPPDVNGTARAAYRLARALGAQGYDIHIVCQSECGPPRAERRHSRGDGQRPAGGGGGNGRACPPRPRGQNGISVPPGEVSACARFLTRVLTDSDLAATMGGIGRAVAATHDHLRSLARLKEIYAGLAQTYGRRIQRLSY